MIIAIWIAIVVLFVYVIWRTSPEEDKALDLLKRSHEDEILIEAIYEGHGTSFNNTKPTKQELFDVRADSYFFPYDIRGLRQLILQNRQKPKFVATWTPQYDDKLDAFNYSMGVDWAKGKDETVRKIVKKTSKKVKK